MKTSPIRFLWMAAGFLCLVFGTVGVILPVMPTVPFYMATAFCFAKSSRKLHQWFLATKLYKKHLESFVEKKAMTVKTKCSILGMVTMIMAAAFVMIKQVPVGRVCLMIVWVFHLLYFLLRVGTIKEEKVRDVGYD